MRKLLTSLTVLFVGLVVAAPAQAAFGVQELNLRFAPESGTVAPRAGSHPGVVETNLRLNTEANSTVGEVPAGALRNLEVNLPPGLVGRPAAAPSCTSAEFVNIKGAPPVSNPVSSCPAGSQVGVTVVNALYDRIGPGAKPLYVTAPVFNLTPAPGTVQKVGFWVNRLVPVTIEFSVSESAPYHVVAKVGDVSQVLPVYGTRLLLWGNPASNSHDGERLGCIRTFGPILEDRINTINGCEIPANGTEAAYITLPTSCAGPLLTEFVAESWTGEQDAGASEVETLRGCDRLPFQPTISAAPTTKAAQSPSGLDFSLDVADEGITSPEGTAQSDIRKAVVTLPEGFSTNPSLAEGLTTCTEADLARETASSEAGQGCPQASKIGSAEVETPLLEESVNGSLYVATPYENQAEDSLIGLYLVLQNRQLGISLKQPLKVVNDPQTGRITTFADELPQLPFAHFKLRFREGTRSPLASGPLCGAQAATAVLTPWSGGPTVTTSSMFSIISGPNSGPCPTDGTPPFRPELEAGTINNAAGQYSPFYLHMTRTDGEQEITHFSIKLPPGVSGKLAGIPFCSNAAIAAAKARTGPHGGEEEVNVPSCPKASEVGRTLVGAGVGPSLAYAPGKVYLAGPYNGSALSIAAITAAKVGPFDLGTVVIRSALKVNPETAEVFVDATGSDPIPHIIKGIPVHLRDIRVYVDKPDFVLNPTSCERTSTASTVLGSGTNFASEADDVPVTVTSPFQAASCASLGFGPKLDLTLKGGTKRGDTPALKAVLTARKGDANIGKAQVTLPHSEFLEQAHIGTVCTRPQFKAGNTPGEKCPAASVYGYAKAVTPLLDEPLQGPVYLRSSSHPLPDLVAALNSGKIDIALAGRIDSVQNGRIRNTFEAVPDAPVTKFTLEMKGGKKGLLVNSTNLCKRTNRAIADFTGQNGKKHVFNPVLKAQGCSKAKKKARGKSKAKANKRLALSAW